MAKYDSQQWLVGGEMMTRILVKVDVTGSTEFFEGDKFGVDSDGKLVIQKETNKDTWKIIGLFGRWDYVRYVEV